MSKLCSYEINLKYINGLPVTILGTTKKSIEEYFKSYDIKVIRKIKEFSIEDAKYSNIDDVYKTQLDMILKYLKTKKIIKDFAEKLQK